MENDFSFVSCIDKYPPVIPRAKVNQFFPWLSPKRMANLDGLGEGPRQACKNGRAVLYPTKSFLEWLDARNSTIRIGCKKSVIPGNISNTNSNKKRGRKTKVQERKERLG